MRVRPAIGREEWRADHRRRAQRGRPRTGDREAPPVSAPAASLARARPSIAAGAPAPRGERRRSGSARSQSRADCAPGATPRSRNRADSPCRAAGAGAPLVASAPQGRDRQRSRPAVLRRASPPGSTMRPGTTASVSSTRSTSNSKRMLRSEGCGRAAITPSMRMSRPSHSAGRASAKRARHQRRPAITRGAAGGQHEDPPSVGEDSGRCGQEHGNAQTGEQHAVRASGNSACCCRRHTPAGEEQDVEAHHAVTRDPARTWTRTTLGLAASMRVRDRGVPCFRFSAARQRPTAGR